MSNIQLFQNNQTADIVQMMWEGQITVSDIREALANLEVSINALSHPTHLIVIIAPDTQLPVLDALRFASYAIHNDLLIGWLVIGRNRQANEIITRLLATNIPTAQP